MVRQLPILVLTLARPELTEHRPGWGTGKRGLASLYLDPLSSEAMGQLLAGLARGCPRMSRLASGSGRRASPSTRSKPCACCSTRASSKKGEDGLQATADLGVPEIPETLHALVLARLDALAAPERELLQDAAVLGKMFTVEGLQAVSGLEPPDLEARLDVLVRRELIAAESDPRSPDRGLYGFVQALVRTVAYETMGLRDRKRRHLATARHLAAIDQGDELVELIATHTLDAYRLVQGDDDAAGLRAEARGLLLRAAERARSLAAPSEAKRLVLSALDLEDDEHERAELLALAGVHALAMGNPIESRELLERALAVHTAAGDEISAAHVLARLGDAMFLEGRPDEALGLIRRSYEALREGPETPELAEIAAQYGRIWFLAGGFETATPVLEHAIDLGERLQLPEVLSDALNTRALTIVHSRPETARTLLQGALRLALDADLPIAACRAYFNLSFVCECAEIDGRPFDREGMAISQKLGDRGWELAFRMHIMAYDVVCGEWDSATQAGDIFAAAGAKNGDVFLSTGLVFNAMLLIRRGRVEEGRRMVEETGFALDHADPQMWLLMHWMNAVLAAAEDRPADAVTITDDVWRGAGFVQGTHAFTMPTAFVRVAALYQLDDRERARSMQDWINTWPPGLRPPTMRALWLWLDAWLDNSDPDDSYDAAAALLRAVPRPWELAQLLVLHARELRARGVDEAAQVRVAEAAAIYGQLEAAPALDQLRAEFGTSAAEAVG